LAWKKYPYVEAFVGVDMDEVVATEVE